jgi:RNA polymerase sigma-70 factor (ECF subfamily)
MEGTDRVSSREPTPDLMVEREEARVRIEAAFAELPAPQREAVLLFDLEGWSHARIAESLGTSEAMSRQHLMLGRRALRRLLEEKEPIP